MHESYAIDKRVSPLDLSATLKIMSQNLEQQRVISALSLKSRLGEHCWVVENSWIGVQAEAITILGRVILGRSPPESVLVRTSAFSLHRLV